MKIKDIMTDQLACIKPESTVTEAAQMMQKHDVGVIPVCEGEKVIGILTDRDIVVRNIAHGNNPQVTPVRDVMSSEVTYATPEMSIHQAAGIMAVKQIRRLPVVEEQKLVGMVSLGDLATKGKYDVELSTTLSEISEPSQPENL
ncbi:MAG TPA: CBS domain-containing protein [Bacillota bacterium]|nr:CBS domain-containing protein [Bacillota bacterium]